MVDEDKLEGDLILTAAWCEYKFPHIAYLRLFAAVQRVPVAGQLAVAVADTLTSTHLDGPVVGEATRALTVLGYSFAWNPGGDVDLLIQADASDLSAHERLMAVGLLRERGLV